MNAVGTRCSVRQPCPLLFQHPACRISTVTPTRIPGNRTTTTTTIHQKQQVRTYAAASFPGSSDEDTPIVADLLETRGRYYWIMIDYMID